MPKELQGVSHDQWKNAEQCKGEQNLGQLAWRKYRANAFVCKSL